MMKKVGNLQRSFQENSGIWIHKNTYMFKKTKYGKFGGLLPRKDFFQPCSKLIPTHKDTILILNFSPFLSLLIKNWWIFHHHRHHQPIQDLPTIFLNLYSNIIIKKQNIQFISKYIQYKQAWYWYWGDGERPSRPEMATPYVNLSYIQINLTSTKQIRHQKAKQKKEQKHATKLPKWIKCYT